MAVAKAFNFRQWIDEHRHLLKPPVGNQQIYMGNSDYIVMVVGGPNARKDYHYNESEELFFQVEGDIVLKLLDDGQFVDIDIKEGEMFLLPPRIPHSPQRKPNTVGLVIERYRREGEKDGFMWYCEQCGNKLFEQYFDLVNIVTQFPPLMEKFYGSDDLCTCAKCGTKMERPQIAK